MDMSYSPLSIKLAAFPRRDTTSFRGLLLNISLTFLVLGIPESDAQEQVENLRITLDAQVQYVKELEQHLRGALAQIQREDLSQQIKAWVEPLRGQAQAMKGKLAANATFQHEEEAGQVIAQLQNASTALSQIQNVASQLGSLHQSYALCNDSPYFFEYQKFLRSRLDEHARNLADLAGGKLATFPDQPELYQKENVYASILLAIHQQRSFHTYYGQLGENNPVLKEFQGFCEAFIPARAAQIQEIDQWLAGRGPKPLWLDQNANHAASLSFWQELVSLEQERIQSEQEFRDIQNAPDCQAYREIVQRESAVLRSIIAIWHNPVMDEARANEEQRLSSQWNQLRESRGRLRVWMGHAKELADLQKQLRETLAQRPVLQATDIPLRFDRLVKNALEVQALVQKTRETNERVETLEAQGRLEVVIEGFQHLIEEAELMAEVLEIKQEWEQEARNPEVAQLLLQYNAQLARLKELKKAYYEKQVLIKEIDNRIRMLELKNELTEEGAQNLEERANKIEEEMDEQADRIEEAIERAREGVQQDQQDRMDQKDADKVPLDAPVDRAVEF